MRRKIKIKNKILIIPGFLLIIASFLANLFLYQKLQVAEESIRVERVIDGDTFVFQNQQKIRLFATDAPLLDFCGGQEAKDYLEELILGKTVRVERKFIDGYQRINALVFRGSKLINEEMLEAGWAIYDGSDKDEKALLKKAFNKAREEEKGIFSQLCRQKENLENPECSIKGNIVVLTGDKYYHFPGCRQYEQTIVEKNRGEQWFCTEKEAQEAGYKKAKGCNEKEFEKQPS